MVSCKTLEARHDKIHRMIEKKLEKPRYMKSKQFRRDLAKASSIARQITKKRCNVPYS